MPISDVFRPRIAAKLRQLYGKPCHRGPAKDRRAGQPFTRRFASASTAGSTARRPSILITYGDQVSSEGRSSAPGPQRVLARMRMRQGH